jgi:phosphoribosylformimino-5-aminoimidazole carboxamide ribotide isomerase
VTFELYPAIDLRAGRCVRLYQGDYAQETVYGDDPPAQARRFADAGARWIHVVDLDAARSGEPVNRPVVADIAATLPSGVGVQTGGGVRSVEAAEALFAVGVRRVVLGTAALEDPDLVARLAGRFALAVGLDVRGREVAVRGWEHGSGLDVADAVERFADHPVAAYVVTQIAVDGTLVGPDLDLYRALLDLTATPVVASGGVGTLHHIAALRDLESAAGRRLAGVIVGRALYEGAFTLGAALAVAAGAAVG